MARKERKYHFIYKTTNLINNKYYIGMHSTDNLNDGYVGSGKRLWYSINKYGKQNFKVEILEFLPDRISLKKREKEIVHSDLIKEELCMNLMVGGQGGFISDEQQRLRSVAGGNVFKYKMENDIEFRKKICDRSRNEMNNRIKNGTHKPINLSYDWNGKNHKPETIIKIRNAKKDKYKGEKSSQFGTCWITNEIENKKIKKEDFYLYQDNWRLGRTPLGNIGKNQYPKITK